MKIEELKLKNDERVVFELRDLYLKNGYKRLKMSKFEEYDFYSKNKDYLVSDGIITFTDTDGKLLALKPDVTLSIIKNSKDSCETKKYFYNENVYRISKSSKCYKEIMQTGIECIGNVGKKETSEVLLLAAESLERIDENFRLCLSSIDFVESLLSENGVSNDQFEKFIEAINEKNADSLLKIADEKQYNNLRFLFKTYNLNDIDELYLATKGENSKSNLDKLKSYLLAFKNTGYSDKITVDFSFTGLDGYYNGIVFKGFINGIASAVISGGQYDNLMKKMGRESKAIGFAVYLDEIERFEKIADAYDSSTINVALPKGRLGEKIYSMFERAGLDCPSIKENSRKLIHENDKTGMRFFWVKPSDVAIYVERGAADIGVAGKDILLEYAPDVFELLDLKEGKCRMAVAAKRDFVDDEGKTLRVATKFSNIAKEFYKSKCRDIEIIHLNGSIELAPILNLSDVIVDIVETGKTLLENNLEPIENIVDISARLISNKSSYSFKTKKIEEIKSLLEKMVN